MDTIRTCNICKIAKPFTDFYWDSRFNLPFGRCKPCYLKKCRAYRHSEKGKKVYAKWLDKNGRDVRNKALLKWRLANDDKYRAHYAVTNAVRDGRLKKEPCIKCGNPKSEAHHESYSEENWLNVIWVCRTHHSEITYESVRSK